jgi:hypothetical protein
MPVVISPASSGTQAIVVGGACVPSSMVRW